MLNCSVLSNLNTTYRMSSPILLANNIAYRIDPSKQGLIVTDYSNKAKVHMITRLGILKIKELIDQISAHGISGKSVTASKHGAITVEAIGHCFMVEARPRNSKIPKMELVVIAETVNGMVQLIEKVGNEAGHEAEFHELAMVA